MTIKLPYKTKQFFFVLVKLSIVVAAFYFIYQKIVKTPNIDFLFFKDFLHKSEALSLKNCFTLLSLSVFNWYFEILKWQTLVSPIKKISFKNAMEQSLGSLTASLITPNRIGEYGAKAIYYEKAFRKRILLINLMGNMAQMTVTCIFGIVGLSLFTLNHSLVLKPFEQALTILFVIGPLCFILYTIVKKTINIRGFSLRKIVRFIINFPRDKIYLGIIFSCLRYLLFSFQFYYLLVLFNTEITYLNAMTVITSMYFLASIIPSIFIFDAVIKGSIALYLFSFLGINEFIILSIVMIMWLLNFVLPSTIGSFYVLNFKIIKENN